MHNLSIVHRDLKLENILINEDANNLIKIIDFGFSTSVRPDQKLSIYCGTPCYMDPDLARKRKYSGFAADVWALGVILYIILTGGIPFFGNNEIEMF